MFNQIQKQGGGGGGEEGVIGQIQEYREPPLFYMKSESAVTFGPDGFFNFFKVP